MEPFLHYVAQALNRQQELLVVALVLARTMPMVIQTPFLGGKIAPPEIKMALGVMFTIVIWPAARGAITGPLPTDPVSFLLLMLKEIFIGTVLGYINYLTFSIMEMAGRLIDTARGSSMAEVLVPHSGGRATPFGDLYYQLFLVLFIALGAHGIYFDAFFNSFATIPLTGSMPEPARLGMLAEYVTRLSGDVFLAAVLLAAPVLGAVLVTDVVFGILNRVAPQLNAYFMAMPVKAMGGVIVVLSVMDAFVSRLTDYAVWNLAATERIIDLFTPR